ncbi:MAG: hypothetical protein KU37_06885 [Sulfuricurvum sp. PC08-66]|nr:MAG: hypothetical protein KU37_06885 [Sulfuricurvum sp. PC08-66]
MEKDTRERLIEIAFDEIHTYGYQGASLTNILKRAKVNKGSMYYYFPSKKALALAAIEETLLQLGPRAQAPYIQNLFSDLRTLFSLKDVQRGEPFAGLVQEMSYIDEDFRALLQRLYVFVHQQWQHVFDLAVEAGEIPPTNTAWLTKVVFALFEGAFLGSKATQTATPFNEMIDAIEHIVYHCTPPQRPQ